MHYFEREHGQFSQDEFREFTQIPKKVRDSKEKIKFTSEKKSKIHPLWSMDNVGRNATKSWF